LKSRPINKILAGKNILITGGTSVLGRAFVRKAVEAGGSVFFTYYQNQEEARALESAGARGFCLNLADFRAIENFQKEFRAQTKELHVLIHNAAATHDGTLQNLEESAWDEVMTVNLKAPYFLTKKFLSFLFKVQPAKIFFIVSRAALQGIFGAANYAASKAGLVALAKSLAQELGKKEILVNCVNPGFMKSRMTESLPAKVIEKNLAESALGRWSNPEEVADFLVYLSSDQMTQVTGQIFHFESRKT